ncbi:MAG: leucine--tRNA ligase [Candidatus Gracilibacteria bacterium]|jgi:leucyl-tRNA synthetase|nr:leucine--tRNA ligase [Candidatus Gracilibacteria bacterium]
MEENRYSPQETEKKWQEIWKKKDFHNTDLSEKKRKKFYGLVMFPYPSGDKLHLGHWYNFGIADSAFRFQKMQGQNVFAPFGFDSFGLPAENFAIKTGVHPADTTEANIKVMERQIDEIGGMYDFDKEVVTSRPDYYKWTQWLFLQMYKNGLAYRKNEPANWCPECQTVLANEQVQGGKCDRCGSEVTRKMLNQWALKLSSYAEKLLDYEGLDWPEKTIKMQQNWIGKSHGAEIDFRLTDGDGILTAYTTRPDTIYSVTFVCIAPEHPLVDDLVKGTKYEKEVNEVRSKINKQTLIERTSEGGEDKIGCFTGRYVVNPVTKEEIPVYIANFVLMYGTGVVMACAHDQRDFEFAKKYNISLRFVISENGEKTDPKNFEGAYTGDGVLFDSGDFSGMNNREALPKMVSFMEGLGFGRATVNYKLRDWLLSRQRYWGAPIPIVYCDKCGEVPVEESSLPVELPRNVDFKPTGDGMSPLAKCSDFVNTKCPKCGGPAKREVDTMDTFVCSSWYYLRYPCSKMTDKPFDKDVLKKWMPVDLYIGGPEHACMHLIYARFVNRVLFDLGLIDHKEPFKKLIHQGMITKDGAKMSKSKGNTVSPDEFVAKYGSDVLRMYLMFMGPYSDGGDWSDKGIVGISRFQDRFFRVIADEKEVVDMNEMHRSLHKLIKKVSEDIESFHFNTAISALMEFVNLAMKNGLDRASKKVLVQLIAPLAPHLAEECFSLIGEEKSVFESVWPKFDKKLIVESKVKLGVQVNGKVRGEIEVDIDASKEDVLELARSLSNVQKYLVLGEVVKEIFVPGKVIGFVVKEK